MAIWGYPMPSPLQTGGASWNVPAWVWIADATRVSTPAAHLQRREKAYNNNYSWLVVLTILKNMKVNGKDYPIHCGKIKNAWNHQPDRIGYCSYSSSSKMFPARTCSQLPPSSSIACRIASAACRFRGSPANRAKHRVSNLAPKSQPQIRSN